MAITIVDAVADGDYWGWDTTLDVESGDVLVAGQINHQNDYPNTPKLNGVTMDVVKSDINWGNYATDWRGRSYKELSPSTGLSLTYDASNNATALGCVAVIRGTTTNYYHKYSETVPADGGITIDNTYADGMAVVVVMGRPGTYSSSTGTIQDQHNWTGFGASAAIITQATDGTSCTVQISGPNYIGASIFAFQPVETPPDGDQPSSYTGWYSSEDTQLLSDFKTDLDATGGTAAYATIDNGELILPLENPVFGLGGLPVGINITVKAKSASADNSTITIEDIFTPWGPRSGESSVTNSGSAQDLGTSYAYYSRLISQQSTGDPWTSYSDVWYQDVGLIAGVESTVYVDAVVVEVARAEPTGEYDADAWRFTPQGHLITSWIHAHLIDVDKYFSAIKGFVRNVNTSDYRVYVDYRIDTDTNWTVLSGLPIESETAAETSLYKDGHARGKKIQFRFRFETEDLTTSPDMIAWVLESLPKLPRRRIFTAPIRIQAYRENVIGGITYESAPDYYQKLVDLVETSEPVTVRSGNPLVDGTLVHIVGVDNERIIENPADPNQIYIVATLTFIEVD